MNLRRLACLFAIVGALLSAASSVKGEDNFGILIEQSYTEAGDFVYDFGFLDLCKDGATSGTLTIGDDSYTLSDWGGCGWFPDSLFLGEHRSLSHAQLQAVLASGWVITWDHGLPSETVASIDFGDLADEFPPMPEITNPPDGADDVRPGTSIDWVIDADPGFPGISYFSVDLRGPGGDDLGSWIAPGVTTWSPDSSLAYGEWTVRVSQVHQRIGDISEDVSILSGSWDLGDGAWFQYWCIDQSRFMVPSPSPIERTSWGALKNTYR